MNPIFNTAMFYTLMELYQDSLRADYEWLNELGDAAAESGPWEGSQDNSVPESEPELPHPGSIMIMELRGKLICYVVLSQREDGHWLAQQLSMFTEFGASGDLLVKAHGGDYLALAENSFTLFDYELQHSIQVDKVGIYDLILLQEFVESNAYEHYPYSLQAELPRDVRRSFVFSEYDLSCELRSRAHFDLGFLSLPRELFDHHHVISYSMPLFDASTEMVESMQQSRTVRDLTLSEPPNPIVDVRSNEGFYEIRFDSGAVNRWAELRLNEVLLFRGHLPQKIRLKLPIPSELNELRRGLAVEFIRE